MKKLLYIFILFAFGANAQSISNQVISSYGLSASTGTAQTDVTIGEPIIATVSDGNNTLTQGFHQTKLIVTAINENKTTNTYNFYPNPVNETLNFSNTDSETVKVQLFDVAGKLLWSKQNVVNNEQINFNDKPKGTYIIKVTDNKNYELKTIKVVKN